MDAEWIRVKEWEAREEREAVFDAPSARSEMDTYLLYPWERLPSFPSIWRL